MHGDGCGGRERVSFGAAASSAEVRRGTGTKCTGMRMALAAIGRHWRCYGVCMAWRGFAVGAKPHSSLLATTKHHDRIPIVLTTV